jgi:hemerythrin-like domain-containing protein
MRLLDVLVGEHQGVSSMLDVLDAVATRAGSGADVPIDMVEGIVDYFERCSGGHHTQEERLLFPLLEQLNLGWDETVVNALLAQHEAHRAYTRKMRADVTGIRAGEAVGWEAFSAHAHGYTELIREHIRIEDHYFRGIVEEALTRAERDQISEAFSHPMGSDLPAHDRDRFLRIMQEYPRVVQGWSRLH